MDQLNIIQTKEALLQLKSYLADKEVVAVDTEATGLSDDADIIGISLCAEPDVAFYVILSTYDVATTTLVDLPHKGDAIELLKVLQTKQLVMHNATFDCALIKRCYKIDLMPSVAVDTLMLAHLLNENRSNALKELGASLFGESAKEEQKALADSVTKNGGTVKISKKTGKIEIVDLYKADAEIIGKYGAKDAILTYKLFLALVEELNQYPELWKFFFDDESMPLLRGPTYELNTAGLRVDVEKLNILEFDLRNEIKSREEKFRTAVNQYLVEKFPGTTPKNTFNMSSNEQLAWLLFRRLDQEFNRLTDGGRKLAKQLIGKLPYSKREKRDFIKLCCEANKKPEKYMMVDKSVLEDLKHKFSWIDDLMEYKRLEKLLTTYVEGIQRRMRYGIVKPGFLQHGTTSGRYSSQNPNCQNIPRDDKRIKSCLISRPGKVFVGADYSQLEARVFASFSQDFELLKCFEKDQDFYSVIGMYVFGINDCGPYKEGPNAFGEKYKTLRQIAKTIALAVTYGTTANKLAQTIKNENGEKFSLEECQKIIDDYMEAFPGVKKFMNESHRMAIETGESVSLFGRIRRIPEAKKLRTFGHFRHERLPYDLRNPLNLSVNHRVQSTAASIINRSCIALQNELRKNALDAKIVLQVHDSLVVECLEKDVEMVKRLMKHCMENTVELQGVRLIAEPKVGRSLADV